MGILYDHCKRTSQIIFAYFSYIDPVIEYPSPLDLIKPVDQINDRSLPLLR